MTPCLFIGIDVAEADVVVTQPAGDGATRGLHLRHDHGSNSLADDFQRRSRSSGLRVPQASGESPKATAWRSALSAR